MRGNTDAKFVDDCRQFGAAARRPDDLYCGLAWCANTDPIFKLDETEAPLLDMPVALEAASGDVDFLVSTAFRFKNSISFKNPF